MEFLTYCHMKQPSNFLPTAHGRSLVNPHVLPLGKGHRASRLLPVEGGHISPHTTTWKKPSEPSSAITWKGRCDFPSTTMCSSLCHLPPLLPHGKGCVISHQLMLLALFLSTFLPIVSQQLEDPDILGRFSCSLIFFVKTETSMCWLGEWSLNCIRSTDKVYHV